MYFGKDERERSLSVKRAEEKKSERTWSCSASRCPVVVFPVVARSNLVSR